MRKKKKCVADPWDGCRGNAPRNPFRCSKVELTENSMKERWREGGQGEMKEKRKTKQNSKAERDEDGRTSL